MFSITCIFRWIKYTFLTTRSTLVLKTIGKKSHYPWGKLGPDFPNISPTYFILWDWLPTWRNMLHWQLESETIKLNVHALFYRSLQAFSHEVSHHLIKKNILKMFYCPYCEEPVGVLCELPPWQCSTSQSEMSWIN